MGTDRKEGWDECTLFLYQSLFVARSTLLSNLSPLTKSLEQASVHSSVSAEMHVDQSLNDNRNYRLKWKLDNMKSLHGFLGWNVVCTAVLRKDSTQNHFLLSIMVLQVFLIEAYHQKAKVGKPPEDF